MSNFDYGPSKHHSYSWVPIGTIVQEKKMYLSNGDSETWIACNCSFVCHINIWRNMDALPNVPVNHGFN